VDLSAVEIWEGNVDADAHDLGSLVVGLRRYALALTGDLDQADDLVEDALVRARGAAERQEQSEARLRLYAILVDRHRSRPRPRLRRAFLSRGFWRERNRATRGDLARWREIGRALDMVDDEERRALLLVVLDGRARGLLLRRGR
jgi:RNA polymerase sigma-70 factor (ECF subfamily)